MDRAPKNESVTEWEANQKPISSSSDNRPDRSHHTERLPVYNKE
jgi:hypothetical protein